LSLGFDSFNGVADSQTSVKFPRFIAYVWFGYNSCMSMKSIFMWNFSPKRTVFLDVIQGILIGAGLAFITIFILPKAYATKVNGWMTMYG